MTSGEGLWDVIISGAPRDFLDGLAPENRKECYDTLINRLCRNPRPEDNASRQRADYYPHGPGVIECVIGRWYFKYAIINDNTLRVMTIYFAPGTDDNMPPVTPLPRPTD